MTTNSPAERALVKMLTDDPQLAASVGTSVSPLALDQELSLPALTYELSSSRPMSNLSGAADCISLDFDIFAMAEDFGTASDLGEDVRKTLSGRRGDVVIPLPGGFATTVTILGCTHTNDRTTYSPPVDGGRTGIYLRMLSFLLTYRSNQTDY
jgi:hypothetical protein